MFSIQVWWFVFQIWLFGLEVRGAFLGQLSIQMPQVEDVLRLTKYCRLQTLHRRLAEMTERAQCFRKSIIRGRADRKIPKS